MTQINYNGGKQASYRYNKVGELVEMEDWTGTTSFEVDLLRRITQVTDHKGSVVEYTYDEVGNQTSIDYPDGTGVDYTYDLLHQLKTVTEEDGRTTTYSYDGMGRVVKMEYPHGWVEDYVYDSIGQLLRVDDTDPTQKDMKQQKHVYKYDDCGNMIYEYMRGNGTGEATTENTYTYDALHRITGAKEEYGNAWREYQYDSLGNLIENGNQIRLYYHMDYLGTTDYLTSPVSLKVTSWTHYNEWGEITHNAVLKTGKRELDLVKRYATHDYDAVLGMYYAKARFYDAENRRFASVDPVLNASEYDLKAYIENPIQMVPYLYVMDNPLVYVDPMGMTAAALTLTYNGLVYPLLSSSLAFPPAGIAVVAVVGICIIVGTVAYYSENRAWDDTLTQEQALYSPQGKVGGNVATTAEALSYSMAFSCKKAKNTVKGAVSAAGQVSSGGPKKDDDDDDQKLSLQKLTKHLLDKHKLDAHAIKYEYFGRNAPISLYDLAYDKTTGIIYIIDKAGKIIYKTYYEIHN